MQTKESRRISGMKGRTRTNSLLLRRLHHEMIQDSRTQGRDLYCRLYPPPPPMAMSGRSLFSSASGSCARGGGTLLSSHVHDGALATAWDAVAVLNALRFLTFAGRFYLRGPLVGGGDESDAEAPPEVK